MFAGLSDLVIEDVVDEHDLIRVMARTRDEPVPCPVCGVLTGRVHGFCCRTVTDVPIDGRTVVVSVTVRRLVCPVLGCPRQTFREQVPGLLERYQRRTTRLTAQLGAVVKELAGRAGARLSQALDVAISKSTALRLLMRLPLPPPRVPRVLGVDDFALKRRHRYATILIDAETGERIDVLPGRGADALQVWLRAHPGVEIVCRDGAGAYGEAVRRALPDATQVSDRWHLWQNLCDKTLAEVRSHSFCWATVNPARPAGVREQTTQQRWQQIHDLLDKGVGLLECARRLDLSLNTVKRYARTRQPEALRRAPRYRPTLVDPYRDHLRQRRAAEPAVPVLQLFGEIKELGYTGSLNLLYRYITQGRAEGDRPVVTPRRLARLLLTRPDRLREADSTLLQELAATCPELAQLARLVRAFAELLTPAAGNDAKLATWLTDARAANLPHLHSFANGLELDREAVNAGITLPHHNGRTEGVNTRTKRIMRQMHGRAGFDLLRHRILLH
ncbi:ISL3 family transposase [Planotetraspora sp. A-T 1434]|uniref:ISL3 family transposase n=1 Tax=Planotetraspora sp. A-T 1434 TaxID=2979219 RepID=UPI0021C13D37|nr:ISL3 family transposase [Planotetraspora sp. A-T 1434]MCT9934817.1 ISL3 family transposase [Planotetraspora sp. A-T 1434]